MWQALKGAPTCYIFSCPQDSEQVSPPFHCLIPYSSSREPGLILLSLDGQIRFWDSIGIGLAGGNHYTSISLNIPTGEHVTNLVRSDVSSISIFFLSSEEFHQAQTYVASTTAGNLFRLTLTTSGGKYHLSSHLFARPTHNLSLFRLLPSIFSNAGPSSSIPIGHSRNVNAIAFGAATLTGGKYVWALVDTRLQKWEMKPEGWEEMLLEGDVSPILSLAIRTNFGTHVDEDDAQMDLELLDLAVDGYAIPHSS